MIHNSCYTVGMDIPLKIKYRSAIRSRFKGGHNDSHKKRPGYQKGKHRTGGHVQYVMLVDERGRRRMVPQEA